MSTKVLQAAAPAAAQPGRTPGDHVSELCGAPATHGAPAGEWGSHICSYQCATNRINSSNIQKISQEKSQKS